MYIILKPSMSERGGSQDVDTVNDDQDLRDWLLDYHGDLKRIEIFNAERVAISIGISK